MAIAGGFLTKGLIAFLFPVAVLGLTLAYTRLGVQARKMSWQPALIFLGILVAPWFVLVSLKHPFFPEFFFIHEHVARFLTTVHHRTAPIYFFIPVLLAGFLPWSVFLLHAFLAAFKRRGTADEARSRPCSFGPLDFFYFYFLLALPIQARQLRPSRHSGLGAAPSAPRSTRFWTRMFSRPGCKGADLSQSRFSRRALA